MGRASLRRGSGRGAAPPAAQVPDTWAASQSVHGAISLPAGSRTLNESCTAGRIGKSSAIPLPRLTCPTRRSEPPRRARANRPAGAIHGPWYPTEAHGVWSYPPCCLGGLISHCVGPHAVGFSWACWAAAHPDRQLNTLLLTDSFRSPRHLTEGGGTDSVRGLPGTGVVSRSPS
jgi:hypothetical protein